MLHVSYVYMLEFDVVDWFTHGKGPDPAQAKLDREMDEYQKARAAEAAAAPVADVPVEA